MDSFGLLRISRWASWRIPDPWLSWRICLSPTVLRGMSTDIHQSKLLCGTYSWKTHGPLMNHSWMGGTLEHPPPDKNDDPHRQITMTSPNDGPQDQTNFLYSLDFSSRFLPILSSLCPSLVFKEARWKHLRNPWLSLKVLRGEQSWSTHDPLMNHSWTRASLLWSDVC